ncbi:MAG: NADH-quinone oxidoreductase subunit NuoH [Alphaproteobacteria bacterium]|nr:MAG: NADH-quinone oxidoreductase subunit NuoH [Alphaproteobacteria bacterium]
MAEFIDIYLLPGLWILGKVLLIVVPLLLAVAYAIYFDRKIWAAIQLRRGPNVVGPWGLLQSFADGLKLLLKETIVPSGANKGVFIIAPVLMFVVAFVAWAVIPFDDGLVLSNLNVGVLYLFAISSLGVYGIIMSGWASNSRYAFLGAMRSAAQMVSYEVSIGFVIVTVLLCVGSLNLSDVVMAQEGLWFFIPLFPVFIIFFISALAETNRAPFDLPEAEAELVAGYQVEYSSLTFALFWLGEYTAVLLMCAMTTTLFFGGWLSPFDNFLFNWIPGMEAFNAFMPGLVWFLLKTFFFFFVFSWIKASVPRYRYDQLMRLGWKVFLPLSLVAVIVTAGVLVAFDMLPNAS